MITITPTGAGRSGGVLTFIAVVSLMLLALIGPWHFPALKWAANVPANATQVIGALLIVTLFVERSMAAINSTISGARRTKLEGDLRLFDARLALNALDKEKVFADVKGPHDELVEIDAADERRRVVLGFVFAVLISAAGVRTLESLLEMNGTGPAPGAAQLALAHVVDIFLTAGLIAGGSNGLAELMKQILNVGKPPLSQFR